MTAARIAIADDHPVYLDGLRRAISVRSDMALVGTAETGTDLLEVIRSERPDVAVVDFDLPGLDAIGVLDALARDALSTRVLVVSALDDSHVIYKTLEAGAAGYLSKNTRSEAIGDAVAAVVRGDVVLPAHIHTGLLNEIRDRRHGEGGQPLTARELDVLRLAADGHSNSEIANELHVSVGTVKSHLQKSFEKLGVNDRAAAVAAVIRRGLVR